MKTPYDTLSDATSNLYKKGFKENITVNSNGQIEMSGKKYDASDVKIKHYYRFEGMSNPSDSSICYAIETEDGEKGVLINSYGAESSDQISSFIKSVEIDDEK